MEATQGVTVYELIDESCIRIFVVVVVVVQMVIISKKKFTTVGFFFYCKNKICHQTFALIHFVLCCRRSAGMLCLWRTQLGPWTSVRANWVSAEHVLLKRGAPVNKSKTLQRALFGIKSMKFRASGTFQGSASKSQQEREAPLFFTRL